MAGTEARRGLRGLHESVVGKLWPAERVLVGCRTSKWLRLLLLSNSERVLFKSAITDEADRRDRKKKRAPRNVPGGCDFTVFSNDSVKVQIFANSCSRTILPILRALLLAIRSGWRGSVSHLHLHSNELGDSTSTAVVDWCDSLCTDAEAVQLLNDILPHQPELHRLDLGYNHLDCHWAEAFGKQTVESRLLSHLSLGGNQITDDGVLHLLPWLRTLSGLRHLDFERNDVSSSGASLLAEALREWTCLTSLNLRGNYISASGADALASALNSSQLKFLDLGMNFLADLSAATAFCRTLADCTALTSLNLEENNIGDAGAAHLASSLAGCHKLAHLDLCSNAISSAQFAESLRTHSGITCLNLSLNSIDYAAASSLCAALATCPALRMIFLAQNAVSVDNENQLVGMLPPGVQLSLHSGQHGPSFRGALYRPTCLSAP